MKGAGFSLPAEKQSGSGAPSVGLCEVCGAWNVTTNLTGLPMGSSGTSTRDQGGIQGAWEALEARMPREQPAVAQAINFETTNERGRLFVARRKTIREAGPPP